MDMKIKVALEFSVSESGLEDALAEFDEPGVVEDRQVLRYGRVREAEYLDYLADAQLPPHEHHDDADAASVGKRLPCA